MLACPPDHHFGACPAPLALPHAVVMQLGGSRFFDCYIPALGCDVRIHAGGLLLVRVCEVRWRGQMGG